MLLLLYWLLGNAILKPSEVQGQMSLIHGEMNVQIKTIFCFFNLYTLVSSFFFCFSICFFSPFICTSCPHIFIQGLSCPLGAVDGQRRFCTTRAKTTTGSGVAWRPWQPCDQLTSKASRQKHNSCLTCCLRCRPTSFRAFGEQKSVESSGLPAAFFTISSPPLCLVMYKARGEEKGSQSCRLMENNGVGRQLRASSCKQRSRSSGSLHRNPFHPRHSLDKDLLLLRRQSELYTLSSGGIRWNYHTVGQSRWAMAKWDVSAEEK